MAEFLPHLPIGLEVVIATAGQRVPDGHHQATVGVDDGLQIRRAPSPAGSPDYAAKLDGDVVCRHGD
nr:hypothetical protein [Streptomyces novaecaesareae]